MKKIQLFSIAIVISLLSFNCLETHAQLLKRLKQRAAEAAEETLMRKSEDKAAEETEKAFDSLFNKDWGKKQVKHEQGYEGEDEEMSETFTEEEESDYSVFETTESEMLVYQKFDFIPGEKILLYDDFSEDQIGDFPSKWDTNGSGELVTLSDSDEKWMKMMNQSTYIPMLEGDLPEEFTMEFDVLALGVDQKTTSIARFKIQMDEESMYRDGRNRAFVSIPFALYVDAGIFINNFIEGKNMINNSIQADVRDHLSDVMHWSVAVNKRRFRLWINEEKVVDVPRLIPDNKIAAAKISIAHFRDGKEDILIRNLKIAEGGIDLRHQLVSEGKFSTSGILFDVNSATIKPESYPVAKDIANVLNENPGISIKVVGHTDADGDEEENLTLSKKRAYAVKELLVNEFSVEIGRIDIDGKGEMEPVDTNTTATGKANNRRVEFIKI